LAGGSVPHHRPDPADDRVGHRAGSDRGRLRGLAEHGDARRSTWRLAEVARIYEEGIATGNATFETEVPSWEAWDAAHLAEHRFVAERAGRVAGWIALLPVSSRCCYAGVAEISAYREEARGQGVGSELLATAVES